MKTIFLHIGTHKTGSTSLQRWLSDNEMLLKKKDIGLYRGLHNPTNHMELYLAAMRYDRDSFAKQTLTDVQFDEDYTFNIGRRVEKYIGECNNSSIIMSCEGLSLLRHKDEIGRLSKILGAQRNSVKVILYLRNKKDFLRSYRSQLKKSKKRKASTNYWSALYVSKDTWLTDYQQLIEAYANFFGTNSIYVIDYDGEMRSNKNIIPSFLSTIGMGPNEVDDTMFDSYSDNTTLESFVAKTRVFWTSLCNKLKSA